MEDNKQAAAEAERQRILEEAAKPAVTRALESIAQGAAEADLKTKVQQAIDSASAGVEYGVAQDQRDPQATAPGKPVALTPAAPVVSGTAHTVETGDAADNETTLSLSAINARLAPLSISGSGLAEFGIEPLATDKNAKLYSEAQLQELLNKIVEHIVLVNRQTAAEQLEAA